jgi:hypothetical protein
MGKAVALQMRAQIRWTSPGANPPEHWYPPRSDVGERRGYRAIHGVGNQTSTEDAVVDRSCTIVSTCIYPYLSRVSWMS